jgi:hypothetical protein
MKRVIIAPTRTMLTSVADPQIQKPFYRQKNVPSPKIGMQQQHRKPLGDMGSLGGLQADPPEVRLGGRGHYDGLGGGLGLEISTIAAISGPIDLHSPDVRLSAGAAVDHRRTNRRTAFPSRNKEPFGKDRSSPVLPSRRSTRINGRPAVSAGQKGQPTGRWRGAVAGSRRGTRTATATTRPRPPS